MEIVVDGKLPFLRMLFRKSGTVLTSEVYRKPTDSGLLHFRSHVDNRYKDALVRTMIDRAAMLSSTKQAVAKECDKLRSTFQALQYPDSKFENIMKRFGDGVTNPIVKVFLSRRIRYIEYYCPIRIRSRLTQLEDNYFNYVQRYINAYNRCLQVKKIGDSLGAHKSKPAIVNQLCVV